MSRTLSESDSKDLLARFHVPFAPEVLAIDAATAVTAAESLGMPVALKLCGTTIAHKTERGLVKLGLNSSADVERAADELLSNARPEDSVTGILVAPMIAGTRELIAGLNRDPQFGMTILLGVGGVLAEALADVAVRLVPISRVDAGEMVEQLENQAIFEEFRGEPEVDKDLLIDVLVALSGFAESQPDVLSVDLNPLIIRDGVPIAVDALVELAS